MKCQFEYLALCIPPPPNSGKAKVKEHSGGSDTLNICKYIQMFYTTSKSACMYMYTYVYVHTFTYVHTYVHTYAHIRLLHIRIQADCNTAKHHLVLPLYSDPLTSFTHTHQLGSSAQEIYWKQVESGRNTQLYAHTHTHYHHRSARSQLICTGWLVKSKLKLVPSPVNHLSCAS